MKLNMEVECTLLNNIVVENISKFITDKKIKNHEVGSYTHIKFHDIWKLFDILFDFTNLGCWKLKSGNSCYGCNFENFYLIICCDSRKTSNYKSVV